MFCGVTIRCLALATIILCHQQQLVVLCEYSQDERVIMLKALLDNSAWGEIDDIGAQNEEDSFTGLDLYLTTVDASNIDKTYRSTIHMLACVCTNAVLHFITSVQSITQQCYRVNWLMKKRLVERRRYRRKKVNGTYSYNVSREKHCPNYTKQWELLHLAVREIKKSTYMFICIYDALDYLMNLVQLEENYLNLNWVLHSVVRLQDLVLNINDRLPNYEEGFKNADDSFVVKLNEKLNKFLHNLVSLKLVPFTNAYCIIRDNVKVYEPKQRYTINNDIPAVKLKIKTVMEKMERKYSELGFKYVKQIQLNHNKPENSEV
ncbi:uncharacterized protein LOC126839797 [Adelges cooleyi]|uniref:uncharacterized protein LOC126839797 n=1 Tax=Adelges cooleyi TaxID=133065 RepID=UPI00217F60A9|nr:uncharacterized protein LOC126839797 [Adelges cooleyi]